MANADFAFGLQPIRRFGGGDYTNPPRRYYVPASYAFDIFPGDPVVKAGGADFAGYSQVNLASAGGSITGVVVGFEDQTSLVLGYGRAGTLRAVLVADDPELLFEVQEDAVGGALSLSSTGLNVDLIPGPGDLVNRTSGWMIDSSTAGTGASLQAKIVEFARRSGNVPGAPKSKIWVKINKHTELGYGGGPAVDNVPDAFVFTDVTGATLSTVYTSNTITIAGMDTGVSVSGTVTGGTYSKNGGAYVSTPFTAQNGDTFSVRQTSSASNATPVNVTLTVGGVSDAYTITTVALVDTTPDAFTFTDITGATLSTVYTSNTITVSGLDVGASAVVTVTGGTYSKNGGAYVSTAGAAQNGDTFNVRQTSSGSNSTPTNVTLTIGGVSDTYTVTTVVAPAVAIASINGPGYLEAWSAEWASGTPPTLTPDTSPQTVSVSRTGYDNTGAVFSYTENRTFTQRVRQPYPNQASLSTATVALDDYVYSTDVVAGGAVTNNSTLKSPKPIVNWALADRVVVGNTLRVEAVAFHRDARGGQEIACFKYTVTDGTNTVSGTISAASISTNPYDLHPVIVYGADVNISSLNNGQITLNGEAYPWIGDSTSVASSVTGTADSREFCPKIYLKNPTLLSTPPLTYVDSVNGLDETVNSSGVGTVSGLQKVSTTASAINTPGQNMFATPASALNALRLATSITGGFTDGCEVRISNCTTTFPASAVSATYNNIAACTITRDPNYAQSLCILGYGTANALHRQKYLRVKDVAILRTGVFTLAGGVAPNTTMFENVSVNNNNIDAAVGKNQYVNGMTITGTIRNGMFNTIDGTSFGENRLQRGISTTGGASWELSLALGCDLPNINATYTNTTGHIPNNGIIAFNRILNAGGANSVFSIDGVAASTITGFAYVQNVEEYISATGNPAFRPSGDSATCNTVHFLAHNNTFAGSYNNGRSNVLYDESTGTNRSHTLQSFRGNIHTAINHKGDFFKADGTKTGNWGYLYGVGCQGEFSMYTDATNGGLGSSFAQAYPGLGAKIGTSTTTRQDPLFTNFQAVTFNGTTYTAGAGGGTYSVAGGSPCKTMLTRAALPFDFAGNARPTTGDTTGAYA